MEWSGDGWSGAGGSRTTLPPFGSWQATCPTDPTRPPISALRGLSPPGGESQPLLPLGSGVHSAQALSKPPWCRACCPHTSKSWSCDQAQGQQRRGWGHSYRQARASWGHADNNPQAGKKMKLSLASNIMKIKLECSTILILEKKIPHYSPR